MRFIRINYHMPIYLKDDDAQSMKHVAMEFAQLILCNGNEQCELKLRNFNHPDFTYISSEESTIKRTN